MREQFLNASVKVMRSYDYCHFEVQLGTDEGLTLEGVDALRKQAARLADKAVAQYRTAKAQEAARSENPWRRKRVEDLAGRIEKDVPEPDRTPAQKAILKLAKDDAYWNGHARYDYQDDFMEGPDIGEIEREAEEDVPF